MRNQFDVTGGIGGIARCLLRRASPERVCDRPENTLVDARNAANTAAFGRSGGGDGSESQFARPLFSADVEQLPSAQRVMGNVETG
jgi:hypothetical protein